MSVVFFQSDVAAARALADQGADILTQHTDSAAAMQFANERGIFAFGQDPDMKVKIIWVNTWYDPGKEAAAARALADQGADILTQHTDSAAATQFANERGIYSFGQDSDMIKFGPKSQLTAIINNWTPYYVERINLALGG